MLKGRYIFFGALLLTAALALSGCDAVYRLLQKEGAEEKDIIGEVIPYTANPAVESAQKMLKLYGYNPGTPDGKMGPNTRYALAAFQKDQGLKETKFIDKATWAKLNEFNRTGIVVNGEVDISAVQLALLNAGFDPGKIDGKPGPRTKRMLKQFQDASGLKVDGKIGPKTLSALSKYLPVE